MGQRRAKTKESRALVRTIERAGGQVSFTANGHLRVLGPKGLAILVPSIATRRHRQNNLRSLAYAGIELRPGCEA